MGSRVVADGFERDMICERFLGDVLARSLAFWLCHDDEMVELSWGLMVLVALG